MTKFKLGLAVAAIAVGGFACGGNNTTGNNDNNTTSNNTTSNNTTSNNTSNNTTSNNTSNNTNNTMSNNSNNSNNANNEPIDLVELPKCGDADEPARCQEDPATVMWAPASLLDELYVEGDDTGAPICCFDYDGDGDVDNSLGANLGGFSQLDQLNDGLRDSIAEGSVSLVLEHIDLEALDNDDAFTVNFYLGEHGGDFDAACETADDCAGDCLGATGDGSMDGTCGPVFDPAGANPVSLTPESFDTGAQSQAYLPMASATDGAVAAGPGNIRLQLEILGTALTVTIRQARVEANINPDASALDQTGVALTDGRLGGIITTEDIVGSVNDFTNDSCSCLGLDGADLVTNDLECNAAADETKCTEPSESACADIVGFCGFLPALSIAQDIDTDGDGIGDAISIGATYSAVGAEITGLTE